MSVVIPVYNGAGHVGRAIESVLKQKLGADEIIVVDDGSTDNTAEIVASYGAKVRLIQQENGGVSSARNAGINAARSEWIAFLDSDDEWAESYLEKQIALLKQNPELVWTAANFTLCYCGQDRCKDNLDAEKGMLLLDGRGYFDDYFKAFVQDAAGWTGTMVVKKDALEQAGLFSTELVCGEDLDMWWRIAWRHPEIGYNNESLAIYHFQVEQSATKRHRDPQMVSDLVARHLQLAKDNDYLERFVPCAQRMVRFYIHKYLFDERIFAVGDIVKRFSDILPFYYTAILRILTIWPGLTLKLMPMLSGFNRLFRIKI